MKKVRTKRESVKFGYAAITQNKSSELIGGKTVILNIDDINYKVRLDDDGFKIEKQ